MPSNVFKEFCKSNDSENGAFILPIDEFIYLNIDEFESRPDKYLIHVQTKYR